MENLNFLITKEEMENERFFADILCEMVTIMMMEDGLNINECYVVLSEYYNIHKNKLRMIVHSQYKKTKNKKYLHFSYDYIIYDKQKKKFISRNNIAIQYKNIIEKLCKKIEKKFSELTEKEQEIILEKIVKYAKGGVN